MLMTDRYNYPYGIFPYLRLILCHVNDNLINLLHENFKLLYPLFIIYYNGIKYTVVQKFKNKLETYFGLYSNS